jgi:deoxyribodipyrimidine photo-lyase
MLSRFFTLTSMYKHPRSPSSNPASHKRSRPTHSTFSPIKVASASAASAIDTNPPLPTLLQAVREGVKTPAKGDCVVYWMRMADLRSMSNLFPHALHSLISVVSDNRALFMASEQAKRESIPLIVLFAISPQDYIAHDRSARRIDFTLRNLAIIKASMTYPGSGFSSYFNCRHPCQIFTFLSTP